MKNEKNILRFDLGSEKYQTNSIKYRKISADRVSQLIEPNSKDTILDIGCGTGTQLIELSKKIKKGIGIDISEGMIKKSKAILNEIQCSNVEFYMGDFLNPEREISLSNMKITKIINNYAMHHLSLEDKKVAINKMIEIAGDSLEMIVIGDLMFFDDPKKYIDQYNEIGYGPANDFPCYSKELIDMFDENLFSVNVEKIHPLVGVLKATVKNRAC